MNKFIFRLLKFISVQSLVLLIVLVFYVMNHDKTAKTNYLAATLDKHALLAKQQKPRVIFLGGSNVAFGLDSSLIGRRLNRNPVNMGLHAAVGLEYMLNEVEASLVEGDIVVISFEYEQFSSPLPDIPERLYMVIENRPQNLQFVPWYYAPIMLDKGQLYLGGVIRTAINSVLGTYEIDRVYQRSNLNEIGDATINNTESGRDLTQIKGKLTVNDDSVQTAITILNEFNQSAIQKGAKIYYSYPSLLDSVFRDNAVAIRRIDDQLKKSLDFPLLDDPKDMAFSKEYFFDSEYHLNHKGAKARSEFISKQLSRRLAESIDTNNGS